jgi:hypothetical protein
VLMVSLRVPGDAGYDASVLVLCEAGVHHSARCTTSVAFPRRMAERLGEFLMPVLFIEAPPGIRPEAKRTMMRKLTEAIDEAYHIGDTLIFLREYSAENVASDGCLQSDNPKINEALKRISSGT